MDNFTPIDAVAGGTLGAIAGAVVGALASKKNKHAHGALVGAGAGAAIGAVLAVAFPVRTGWFAPADPNAKPPPGAVQLLPPHFP